MDCAIHTCSTPTYARGWCRVHYYRWNRHGDPLALIKPLRTESIEESFWAKVDKTGECWVWTAARDAKGYGHFNRPRAFAATTGARRGIPAHRFSWELLNGPIPDGLVVCHHCDNPPCVRPAHLFIGTKADNNTDMCRKGRHQGGLHGRKLSPEDVESIRATYVPRRGEQKRLADLYGVSPLTIKRILNAKAWRHLGTPVVQRFRKR